MAPAEAVNGRPVLRRVLLIRHGESTWNARTLWQGQADPPLSPHGEEQVSIAAASLHDRGIERIVSSDLKRAVRTAEIIAAELGVGDVHLDAGFREIDVGAWSGLTRIEIESRWPGMRAAWSRNELESAPGGELLKTFTRRVVDAVRRTASASGGRATLVVAHSKVISTLERITGLAPLRATHLSGRWFEVDAAGHIRGVDPVNLLGGIREPIRPRRAGERV